MKRGRAGSLAPFTGDVRPQWLNAGTLTMTAADTTIVGTINIPIPRIGLSSTQRATIMEILKVEIYVAGNETDPAHQIMFALATTALAVTGATGQTQAAFLSTIVSDPRVIGAWTESQNITTSGVTKSQYPVVLNMMDGAGHGVLAATDTLSIMFTTDNAAAAGQVTTRILYRTIEVGIAEYVGIVQSQS